MFERSTYQVKDVGTIDQDLDGVQSVVDHLQVQQRSQEPRMQHTSPLTTRSPDQDIVGRRDCRGEASIHHSKHAKSLFRSSDA